ncbi:MAG: bifunctional shikimate kinase/3-dehydroquinate synthase [Solirubrobacterales bacterium]|nr:bifunctional shikimate kinase/3-dehydroquinate synthase [Solirubrobacterales bacterium]
MRPALVFVGFMGAGKTTLAKEAALLLGGAPAADSDRLVEEEAGCSIEELFDRDGEAAFRALEERTACELLERADGGIVSLGGGAVLSSATRSALARHTVVLCEIGIELAWSRAAGKGRPLARDREAFTALYEERRSLYERLADAFLPEGARDALAAALPQLVALADAPEGTKLVWAQSASGDYPVLVGRGVLGGVGWPIEGRRFCITDETVAPLYGGLVPGLAGLVEIPPGEQAKTLATTEAVWRALVAQGATRADHLIALGGGVVGDLAGFAAATFQRGIPVVQVPTTLVAQVDSAYGGKTGVDLPEAKNYVGAYHQPSAVLVDPTTLSTLPAEEFAAGYAEVLKTALIAGGPLWEKVAAGRDVDDATILACARTKLAVVAADERDGGRRQLLNLGHTVGHAIETVTGYTRLRHGEAVGLGLLAALALSGQSQLREEVAALLGRAGLPTKIAAIDPAEVAAATMKDKKRTGEHVPFVLVDGPGDVHHGRTVGAPELLAAITELVG